jgi:TRAP-type C4-dicarboxylate transport system substrate-binding protein
MTFSRKHRNLTSSVDRTGSFLRMKASAPAAFTFAATLSAVLLLTSFIYVRATQEKRPKVAIKFATLAPEGSAWMKTMHQLDDDVRIATNNRLGFKFYTGGVQGDERDVLRKIRNGQLHGGGFTGYGLGSIAPEVRVLELPFMFRNHGEIDYVRSRMDSLFAGIYGVKNMLFLGWADVGFINIFSNQPIRSPSDLQNAKMWIWSGDPLAELFFKAFRVSPIPLSVPDVLTSLQMGVIDAVYASPLACVSVQWYTRVKYMTDIPVTYSIGAVLVSKSALRKVSAEDTALLLELSNKYLRKLNAKTRVQNLEAVDVMRKEAIQVVSVDEDARKSFFATGRNAWSDGIGKIYSKEILERVTALVNEYRRIPNSGVNKTAP